MNKKNKEVISVLNALLLVVVFLFLSKNSFGEINTKDYQISVSSISEVVKIERFKEVPINIINKRSSAVNVLLSVDENVTDFIRLGDSQINIQSDSNKTVNITIFADSLGSYNGSLFLSGGINERIPIKLIFSQIGDISLESLIFEVSPLKKRVFLGDPARFKINVQNLLSDKEYNVTLRYSISKFEADPDENLSFFNESEDILIDTSMSIFKEFNFPDTFNTDEYVLDFTAEHRDSKANLKVRFFISTKLMDINIFGVKVRWLVYGISGLIPLYLAFYFFKKHRKKKKRYKGDVDMALLPKPGPRSVKIGKIAETNKEAFFDIDQLTMHTLIAGSTGGGKTVSAEVLIEEALLKNITVFVFDPTAQWTGFLRRCTSKKMLALYPKFGLKKSDARAFNGNVHQILNARQIIDVRKYMIPGEIHCFAVNKLDPESIDTLVTNTIREVFHADLPESPELKLIVIFDEVHRLLPKFGGSGQGFLQIERGAREFRKWGVGLILISQVLTDFIGETKANINTEVQMRTRDQGDLDRIKTKYGGYMLQSLLKASTGTGMIENPAYNRGNPYFVSFRPLLHEHARLSDEELENYNKYNEIIDDLEYQIMQLEEENVDIFDLKLELKMALDKVKSGSFNMVDIYLEGLKPRVATQWEKLGKTPKKLELNLVDEEELVKEFEKAKKDREDYEKSEGAPAQSEEVEKPAQNKLPPLKIKSGVTVNSITELVDSINTMEEDQVMAEKEDFSKWVKQINEEVADKLSNAKNKEEVIIILEDMNN